MELNVYRALAKVSRQQQQHEQQQQEPQMLDLYWTYQCTREKVYLSRPSRTQTLKNPKLRPAFLEDENIPEIPLITDGDYARDPRLVEEMAAEVRLRAQAAKSSSSSSSSDSSSSNSSSSSSSSSSGSSSSSSSSSRSSSSSSSSSSSDSSSSSSSSDSSGTDSSSSSSDESRGRSGRRRRRHNVKKERRGDAEITKERGRCKREEKLRQVKEEADDEAATARQVKRSASMDDDTKCKLEVKYSSREPHKQQQQRASARVTEGRDAVRDGDRQRDRRRVHTYSDRRREKPHEAASPHVENLKKEKVDERHGDDREQWRQPLRHQHFAADRSEEASEYDRRRKRRQEMRSRERADKSRREQQRHKEVEKRQEYRVGEKDSRREEEQQQQEPSVEEQRDAIQSLKKRERRDLIGDDRGRTRRYAADGSSTREETEGRRDWTTRDSGVDNRGSRGAEVEGGGRRRRTLGIDEDGLPSQRRQERDYFYDERSKEEADHYNREARARGAAEEGNIAKLAGGRRRRHHEEGESETFHRLQEGEDVSPGTRDGRWEKRHPRAEDIQEGPHAEACQRGAHTRAWRDTKTAQYEEREERRWDRSAEGRSSSTNVNDGVEEDQRRSHKSRRKRRDDTIRRYQHPEARGRDEEEDAFARNGKKNVEERRHEELFREERSAAHCSPDGIGAAEGNSGRRERWQRDTRADKQEAAREEVEGYRRNGDDDRERRKRDGTGKEVPGERRTQKKNPLEEGAATNRQRRNRREEEKKMREFDGEVTKREDHGGRERRNEDAHRE